MDLTSEIKSKQNELAELAAQLSDQKVITDQKRFSRLSSQYTNLKELIDNADELEVVRMEIAGSKEMLNGADSELRAMAEV